MMNQLKKRILRLIETSEIKEIVDRVNIQLIIVESIMEIFDIYLHLNFEDI